MEENPYKQLAMRLNTLPNGFPPTKNGIELELLARLYTFEEAELASQLRITLEAANVIAERIGADVKPLAGQLKGMARRGLIAWGKSADGPAYGLLPFVVGIYEMQVGRLDEELARLFEEYYQAAFGQSLEIQPQIHRVIPVGESVRTGLEIRPYESASEIIHNAGAWGVVDCICRTQKALIGDPCLHPSDVCLVLSHRSGAFDHNPGIRALTETEALATLRRAADAGLVHSVSNNQQGLSYICNCCTCSCAILRGMSEMGVANVVARSSYVNTVDEDLCLGCGDCIDSCQFNALSLNDTIHIDEVSCVGCGVCAITCPEDALILMKRPEEEILHPPLTITEWGERRAAVRGIDLTPVL